MVIRQNNFIESIVLNVIYQFNHLWGSCTIWYSLWDRYDGSFTSQWRVSMFPIHMSLSLSLNFL